MDIIRPCVGEKYYLCMLLSYRAARSFEELQTVNGILYSIFQDAAHTLGLLKDITENEQCFAEAVSYKCTPSQLQLLFCHLILEGMDAQPTWQNYHKLLSEDYANKIGNLQQGENEALIWIASYLGEHNSQLTQFGLPQPSGYLDEITRIQTRYCNYNSLIIQLNQMLNLLNLEQKEIYHTIIEHVLENKPLTIFINGCAGRGKTFLVNVICIAIRSLKKIIFPCATTGLAALNYNGGQTAHSLFHLPVEENDDGCKCQINLNSERAKLIKESSIIAWDELPMARKGNIEAVDIFLRELCNCNLPFGGKIFIGLGDFRQVAPVIPHAGQMAIVLESIKSSPLWNSFKIYNLQQPIRDAYDPEYSQLMDDIGDGIDGKNVSLTLLKTTNRINDIINFIFPKTILNNPFACQKRAILCLLNTEVDSINETILQQLKGNVIDLYSTDSLENNDETITIQSQQQRNIITTELLNSFNTSGVPKHCLKLKKGCIVTIMRNLSIHDGLCKNSRGIVLNIGQRLVTVQIPTTGCILHLPRITFSFRIPQFPFKINHRQFPLRLAYSSTFNSSQGLTLDRVALNLCTLVFSHGQLYTALTRVRQRNHIMILIENNQLPNLLITKNIVFPELLE